MVMEKKRVLWILMLVAVLSLPGSSAVTVNDQHRLPHIITVDNEPGVADYTSIQEALNHSSPGDTIEVFSGTYYEHGLAIHNDGISLIGIPHDLGNGSDTGKPFINGQGLGDIIDIKARNVTITGFRIENRGAGYYEIIIINWGSNGCIISNNTLRYTGNCIIDCASNYSQITNNTIHDSGRYGIGLGYNHNTVSDNIIDDCLTGLIFDGCAYNMITRNRISNCSQFGIDVGGSNWNDFEYNTIENNAYGLHLYLALYNTMKYNNFIKNTRQAGFDEGLGFTVGNRFIQNYWNRPRFLPYPVVGRVFVVMPWVLFDWRPAIKPNVIL